MVGLQQGRVAFDNPPTRSPRKSLAASTAGRSPTRAASRSANPHGRRTAQIAATAGAADWSGFIVTVTVGVLVVWAWVATDIDTGRLADSGGRIARLSGPHVSARLVGAADRGGCVAGNLSHRPARHRRQRRAVADSRRPGVTLVTPPFVHVPLKWLLAAIRAIPLILVAMLMVGAVGLGPLPGILAIAFHSTGMLAKFYAEAIESIPPGSLAALDSAGATWLQKLRFGAWPLIAPDLVRDTLFRFELNIRESLVLGLVGAGGIGFYIQTYVRTFQYDKAATLTIVVVIFVVLIELLNHVVRRH